MKQVETNYIDKVAKISHLLMLTVEIRLFTILRCRIQLRSEVLQFLGRGDRKYYSLIKTLLKYIRHKLACIEHIHSQHPK